MAMLWYVVTCEEAVRTVGARAQCRRQRRSTVRGN